LFFSFIALIGFATWLLLFFNRHDVKSVQSNLVSRLISTTLLSLVVLDVFLYSLITYKFLFSLSSVSLVFYFVKKISNKK
jgi:hypothetical protein